MRTTACPAMHASLTGSIGFSQCSLLLLHMILDRSYWTLLGFPGRPTAPPSRLNRSEIHEHRDRGLVADGRPNARTSSAVRLILP